VTAQPPSSFEGVSTTITLSDCVPVVLDAPDVPPEDVVEAPPPPPPAVALPPVPAAPVWPPLAPGSPPDPALPAVPGVPPDPPRSPFPALPAEDPAAPAVPAEAGFPAVPGMPLPPPSPVAAPPLPPAPAGSLAHSSGVPMGITVHPAAQTCFSSVPPLQRHISVLSVVQFQLSQASLQRQVPPRLSMYWHHCQL
jgi:hypothetical protein